MSYWLPLGAHLVIVSDNLEDLNTQLQAWRSFLDTRGLRKNVGKIKMLGSSGEAQKPTRNVKWPYGVCSKGVGVNSILCQTWNLWIYERSSGIKACLNARSVKMKVPNRQFEFHPSTCR